MESEAGEALLIFMVAALIVGVLKYLTWRELHKLPKPQKCVPRNYGRHKGEKCQRIR